MALAEYDKFKKGTKPNNHGFNLKNILQCKKINVHDLGNETDNAGM